MTATFTPPLAALTTIFTPPCPTTWLLTTTKVPSQYPSFATTAPASCDPPSWGQYVAQRGFEYYSPAVCPGGFYVGPSCIVVNPRTGQGFPAIQGGETAAYCIPNGHTCTSDTSDFRGGVWGVSRTASVNGAQVTVGPAIQIRWRAEDLDNLETDPLTPGPRNTQPNIQLPIVTEPEASPTPDPETTTTERRTSSTSSAVRSTTTSSSGDLRQIPGFATLPSTSTSTPTSVSSPSSSPSSSVSAPQDPLPPEESQTPAPSPSPSETEQPTAAADPAQGQPASNNRNQTSNFTIAATVLTTILIAIIGSYGLYSILQQYRRYRAGETKEFFVFQAKAWARRQFRLAGARLHIRRRPSHVYLDTDADEKPDKWKIPDAELGTEGPLTELGATQPFGTRENPAELPTPAPAHAATHDRSSWRSRVSRILTVRTRNGSVAAGS